MMNENVKYALYGAAAWSGYRLYTGQPIIPASISSLFSSATTPTAGTVETPAGTLTSTGSETAAAIAAYYASLGQTIPPAIAAGVANGTIPPAAAIAIANLYSPAKTTTATYAQPARVAPTQRLDSYQIAARNPATAAAQGVTLRTPTAAQESRIPHNLIPAAVVTTPTRQVAAPVANAPGWVPFPVSTPVAVATPTRAAPVATVTPRVSIPTPVQTVNIVRSAVAAPAPAPVQRINVISAPIVFPVSTPAPAPTRTVTPAPVRQGPSIPTPVRTAVTVLKAIRATA